MFTIQARRAAVTHNYEGECYAHDGEKHLLIIDALPTEVSKGQQYTLPLSGDNAYDTIVVKNSRGVVVDEHVKFVAPKVEAVKKAAAKRKSAPRKRATKKKS